MPRSVTILGSSGTIGCNTLDIIQQQPDAWSIFALTAGKNVERLIKQALTHQPQHVVIEDENAYTPLKNALHGTGIQVHAGSAAIVELSSQPVDIVICGILGAAALQPVLSALSAGNNVGLANKECLVCAGELVMQTARQHNATIIPVDSEHSALYQAMGASNIMHVHHMTLTASGGPFKDMPLVEMENITPEQAVAHPRWNMGAKISVDSATMINKGLELIEAQHLFRLNSDQLDVVVHPESIIHGLVHFTDGSVIAGLSLPDMRVPIAYALGWPERITHDYEPLNLVQLGTLNFSEPNATRFPALTLARNAMNAGNTATCALNAANEVAVATFLAEKISFLSIVQVIESVLETLPNSYNTTTLDNVLALDSEARRLAAQAIQQQTA